MSISLNLSPLAGKVIIFMRQENFLLQPNQLIHTLFRITEFDASPHYALTQEKTQIIWFICMS